MYKGPHLGASDGWAEEQEARRQPGAHRVVLGRWVGTGKAGDRGAERCQQEAEWSGAKSRRVLMRVVGERQFGLW